MSLTRDLTLPATPDPFLNDLFERFNALSRNGRRYALAELIRSLIHDLDKILPDADEIERECAFQALLAIHRELEEV